MGSEVRHRWTLRRGAGLVASAALLLGTLAATSAMAGPATGKTPGGGDSLGVRVGYGKPGGTPIVAPPYVPGEVLVTFKRAPKTSEVTAFKASHALGATVEKLSGKGPAIYRFGVGPHATVEAAVRALQADPSVAYASPNWVRRLHLIPNDPSFNQQWGLHNIGQPINSRNGVYDADIDAVEAWDVEQGATNAIPVAVLDSGIDENHPDLVSKLWDNTDEIAGNGLDDDNNGYKDDKNGYNFAGITQTSYNQEYAFEARMVRVQTIKGCGQPLTHLGFMLKRVGAPGVLYYAVFQGVMSSGVPYNPDGTPKATAKASVVVQPGEVSDAGYTEIYKPLNQTANLINGMDYSLVFWFAAGDASNYYKFTDNTATDPNSYPGDPFIEGKEFEYDLSQWNTYPNDDHYFVTNPMGNPRDDESHGTHVAGIIGAWTNNGTGVSGVNPGARIMALKIAAPGVPASREIAALRYAADNGARVANMSFGGAQVYPPTQDAINYAAGKGVVLVGSAGNGGNSQMNYPCAYPNVIGVGATDNQDVYTSFSNFNSSVDLCAPGMDILSTKPTYSGESYGVMSGTSQAAPMTSGLASLLIARNPRLTPASVELLLTKYSDDKGAPGRDEHFGAGRINAYNSVSHANVSVAANPANLVFNATQGAANPPAQAITLTSSESGLLSSWSASSVTPWLTSSPGNGAFSAGATATASVSVNIAGLAVGTQNVSLVVDAPGAANSPVTIPVTVNTAARTRAALGRPNLSPRAPKPNRAFAASGSVPRHTTATSVTLTFKRIVGRRARNYRRVTVSVAARSASWRKTRLKLPAGKYSVSVAHTCSVHLPSTSPARVFTVR